MSYFLLAIVFSAFISLLSLAVPISVQMLIDQVANTALKQPVILLSLVLFTLLLISGFLYTVREYVLEKFERRFFARLSYEILLKIKNADEKYLAAGDKAQLINRYFDIMSIKKSLPTLLVGLFTMFFQAVIGLTVTSFYHESFLIFNIILVLSLFVIWQGWRWQAQETAFEISEAKYDVAWWLQSKFKEKEAGNLYAGEAVYKQGGRLIEHHIIAMRRHFRFTVTQLMLLLFLYAFASAALLGIGGLLVTEGQLTLGQLVAAELIMSGIFANFATLGGYWKDTYAMGASIEELYRIAEIPNDEDGDLEMPVIHEDKGMLS